MKAPSFHPLRIAVYGLLITLMGCVSVEKRFEKATEMENRGRHAEAARYYIQVLEKEYDWEDARLGLIRTGALAVEAYLADAREQEERGAYDNAIETLDRLDALLADAQAVGVVLSTPEDYASYKSRLSEAAIRSLLLQAERAEDAGDWEDALEKYRRAQERYDLTTDQAEQVLLARARVHTRWAEQDLEHEYFRAAFDRAHQAIELLGIDHPMAQNALDIQDAAVEQGTRFIIVLPIWLTEDVAERSPQGLVEEANDMLLFDQWETPPMFLQLVDPVQVRRELRRLRYDRQLVTSSQASEIGNVLGADFVIINQGSQLEWSETRMREKTRKTELAGVDTTFIEQTFTARLNAEIEYSIIDPYSRRSVKDGRVDLSVSERMKRGVFDGDYRDLDLSRSERRLFDEEELELAERELEDELLDKLVPELAQELFDELLQRIN